jgi:16S rRNA (guanine(966)-N(2))-methyltransferase RsmD
MRIIAGQYRSRPLRALPGLDTRPTSDRLRETLFNVLTAGHPAALAGSVWLDLFAGTGAVGLEALSRGARLVYFVDSSRGATAAIRDNLRRLGVSEGFRIVERVVASALSVLEAAGEACGYCFLDPPYRRADLYEETLSLLARSRLLTAGSAVCAEHQKFFDPGESFGPLRRYRRLQQGDACLSFYRLHGEAGEES